MSWSDRNIWHEILSKSCKGRFLVIILQQLPKSPNNLTFIWNCDSAISENCKLNNRNVKSRVLFQDIFQYLDWYLYRTDHVYVFPSQCLFQSLQCLANEYIGSFYYFVQVFRKQFLWKTILATWINIKVLRSSCNFLFIFLWSYLLYVFKGFRPFHIFFWYIDNKSGTKKPFDWTIQGRKSWKHQNYTGHRNGLGGKDFKHSFQHFCCSKYFFQKIQFHYNRGCNFVLLI